MWELDYKESWALKNWCFWTVVLEKTLESPLDCKEIQPVHSEGNQSWIFIGRTDVESENPVLWSPDMKNWLLGKDPDTGQDWRQEKGMTEDVMVRWTWVWASSRSWWWTGKPGMLQSMELQRVRHDWATELELVDRIGSLCIYSYLLTSSIAKGHPSSKMFGSTRSLWGFSHYKQLVTMWHQKSRILKMEGKLKP